MQKVLEGDVDKRLIVSRTKTDTVFTVECDSWRVNKTTALFIKSPSLLRGGELDVSRNERSGHPAQGWIYQTLEATAGSAVPGREANSPDGLLL